MRLIAFFEQNLILVLVGKAHHGLAIGAVNGAKVADGLDFRGLADRKHEEIFPTATHQLLQILLAVLGQKSATNHRGEDEQEMMQMSHFELYSMMIFSTLLPLSPMTWRKYMPFFCWVWIWMEPPSFWPAMRSCPRLL